MGIAPLLNPGYVHREWSTDISAEAFSGWKKQAARVAIAALPFFSLYEPLSRPLNLAMGAARVFTSGKQLLQTASAGSCASAAAAVSGFAGTLFAHPLGMFIATLHDLTLDLQELAAALQHGAYKQSFAPLLQALNHALYTLLFFGGTPQIVASSLALQFLSQIARSYTYLQKGERIEGVSHLLMGLIRGHQAIRGWQSIWTAQEIAKAKEEGRPYLPLANRAQLILAKTGHTINALSRWSVRQIGRLLLAPIEPENYRMEIASRVKTAAALAFAIPLSAIGFLISTPCYFAASYLGTGRFEKIESISIPSPNESEALKVSFQNICGQDPWSVFSGGVVPPFEAEEGAAPRLELILSNILQDSPDIYCGQEFDDLAVSARAAQVLSEHGYTCYRDTGCNDPILNHSGLFIAIRDPSASVSFQPFQPEHLSGIGSWCNRGILAVDTSFRGRDLRVANIHLNPGEGEKNQAARLVQLERYVVPLSEEKPALIVGDSNFDTSQPEVKEKMGPLLNALEGHTTCSDEGKHILNGKPRDGCSDCKEQIDVALHHPEKLQVEILANLSNAHSDHNYLSLSVVFA